MCGFFGGIDLRKSIDPSDFTAGLECINHRGPDNTGTWHNENVFLGHKRLSIIDLSQEGNQPFKSSHDDIYIIYNGEIYNYPELKKGLEQKTSFRSSGDTEVLLEGYRIEGIDFFRKIRGIYSFAIYDNRGGRGKLFLVRDPGGVKPLYFFHENGLFLFSSEMKSIKAHPAFKPLLNEDVLKSYLNLGYCTEPQTIYRNINAVAPGMIYELNDGDIKAIYNIKYQFDSHNSNSYNENLHQTEIKIKKAVSRNLVSDVETAVALSGGIDSSLMYYYSHEENSDITGLSVKFNEEEYDETTLAQKYANHLNGKLRVISLENDFSLDVLDNILLNFDQPYADSSAIPVYYLTRATGKFTKVLIGGDGGDELFNGYPSQTWLTKLHQYNSIGPLRHLGKLMFNIQLKILRGNKYRHFSRLNDLWAEPENMLFDWHSWFPRHTMFRGKSPFLFNTIDGLKNYKGLFADEEPSSFEGKVVFDYFRKTMLSDYLRKTDMMSMFNSIEYRVPLLDEDLVNFALSVPFTQKSTLRESKKILRELHKKHYPPETSNAPKKGFTIPLDKSLSGKDFSRMKDLLLNDKENIVTEYISREYIEFLFKCLDPSARPEKEISRPGVYQRILMLYSLQLWEKNK